MTKHLDVVTVTKFTDGKNHSIMGRNVVVFFFFRKFQSDSENVVVHYFLPQSIQDLAIL